MTETDREVRSAGFAYLAAWRRVSPLTFYAALFCVGALIGDLLSLI